MIANETEKEYRVKMRKSAITALISKLPHPTAVQLTLHLLDILGMLHKILSLTILRKCSWKE